MAGKFLLPWFGGAPAVWTTVMLFFQVLLTAGYAYAYWLTGRASTTQPGTLHALLLGLSLIVLAALGRVWPSPLMPGVDWRPTDGDLPLWHIVLLLAVSVGLPYFMLASNGPLMQVWFTQAFPGKSYARLYALSNAGSLAGLIAYPVLVEPALSLRVQGWAWTAAYGLFVLLAGVVSLGNGRSRRVPPGQAEPPMSADQPSVARKTLWLALSAAAALFLLAVTSQISQEVAVIPFLWVLPLAIYLSSFILAFSESGWYRRRVFAVLFLLASGVLIWTLTRAGLLDIRLQVAIYCVLLFCGCMLCHGELYRLRPAAEHLTAYYFMISAGGAMGGMFANLAAPLLFTGYWELYLAWFLALAVVLPIIFPRYCGPEKLQIALLSSVFLVSTLAFRFGIEQYQGALFVERNFYGVLRVLPWQSPSSGQTGYTLVHGVTVHGIQYASAGLRDRPTTYYVEDSGAGLVLLNHPQRAGGLKVGVLGLGIGTLAAYGGPLDSFRLYEINPVVIELARGRAGYFSFLQDSPAQLAVIAGDARISLERELAAGHLQGFNVLVLDTFSSDSIPVHLVTKEAFGLYLQHLSADGVIAVHISNRHIDLLPIFWLLAREFDLEIMKVDRPVRAGDDGFPSQWVLLTRDPALFEIPAIRSKAVSLEGYATSMRLWTDDYSNLFQLLK